MQRFTGIIIFSFAVATLATMILAEGSKVLS